LSNSSPNWLNVISCGMSGGGKCSVNLFGWNVLTSSQSRPAAQQAAMEARFFRELCLPNGTHKTTAPARLSDVDALLDELLPDSQALHVLDVGMSSGVTTLELLDRLELSARRVTGVGIDIQLYAYLERWMGIDVLHNGAGKVLQLATSWCARGRPDPNVRSMKSVAFRALIAMTEWGLPRRRCGDRRSGERIALVTKRLLDRAGFQAIEQDVMQPIDLPREAFDLVRAANILNLAYFPPSRIARIVSNLIPLMKEDGLLAISRTNGSDGRNHGTVFRKDSWARQTLAAVARLGNGSEVEPLLRECGICVSCSPVATAAGV